MSRKGTTKDCPWWFPMQSYWLLGPGVDKAILSLDSPVDAVSAMTDTPHLRGH